MRKEYFLILAILFMGAIFLVLKFHGQQQACIEYTNSVTEDFKTIEYKDEKNSSVDSWDDPNKPGSQALGLVQLNHLGLNFEVTQPAGMGAQIYVCASGDFDGDGRPDLIGLDISSGANYSLKLVRNKYYDGNGDRIDDDGIIFQVDNTKIFDSGLTVGPASITAGDYNGDGLLDFFFYKNGNDSFTHNNFVACMYINQGTVNNPVFYPRTDPRNLNFTNRFIAAGIYCNWAANHLATVDIDKDGDLDILVASQDKIFLMRNPSSTGSFQLSTWEVSELNYDQPTGYKAPVPGGYTDRGTSAVAAADFDRDPDGDIDIVAGSVNAWPFLVYYQNDGTGRFIRSEIPIPISTCTGTVALTVATFKNDGRPDIFGATDAWNAGNQAHIWIYKNMGKNEYTDEDGNVFYEVIWNFLCLNNCNPVIPPYYDVDICTMLDYDSDGDFDLIIADANHSGDYYLIINKLADVYVLYGEAVSLNMVKNMIDPRQYAITKARIINLHQQVKGSANGLKVQYYLSNDGGLHWEHYKTFEGVNIKNFSDSSWYTFNNFGGDLRWKAVLSAPEDPMVEFKGASFDTPVITKLTIEYTYVGRREYSRSSVATSVYVRGESGGSTTNRKLIIAASFIYPGWEGHLRAYDVTGMTAVLNNYSTLRTVTSSDLGSESGRWLAQGVELLWDAGELLQNRDPNTRKIYTAINPNRPAAGTLQRIDFSLANIGILKNILSDVNNDNEGLINFVRGYDRYWRLGDINHSTPAVVGPPNEDPGLMGDSDTNHSYAEFKTAYQNRRKVVYVGANDGMLHCFDVATGEELWAYIPYNLLPRLKEMWAVDAANKTRYFTRRAYVDSSPSVADVYINGEWRTVLVCGQGEGNGQKPDGAPSTSNSYYYFYFALDVTNPEDPKPMWETAGNLLEIKSKGKTYYYFTNGQTWSVPFIGQVKINGNPTWVAFVGSGYTHPSDAGNYQYIGTTLAAIKIADGKIVWANDYKDISDLDSSKIKTGGKEYANIYNSLPGSPNGLDLNNDGYIDYVYIGDLDGRIWRLDTSSWSLKSIYQDNYYYPIITKPAIWVGYSTSAQRIYFGTGGHESAPSNRYYSIIALIDDVSKSNPKTEVEWYMGDPTETNLPVNKKVGSLELGEKVWADPVVANYIVYFSTLKGSIEGADPCQNLGDPGHLYARYVQPMYGLPVGGSALKNAQGQAIDYLTMASKARTAVTVGEKQRVGGTYKQDVYIQEYDSTIEKLEQPVGAMLKIKSWREIYRIIR